jgi:6-phosphogluconolactonase
MNTPGLPNALSIILHDDIENLSGSVASRIAELASQAIAARGAFHLALAGGETPRRCYQKMRKLSFDWPHIHIYFGDERCLPQGDELRNDSMARESLLDHVPIPPGNIHSIPVELGARQASAMYARILDHVVPLDLVLLGMGEDGHTASLFPDNPAADSTLSVVPVFNAPKLPSERVTLGMDTLNKARNRIMMVAGSGKRAALEKIIAGEALPAARIVSAEWHLDLAARPTDLKPMH